MNGFSVSREEALQAVSFHLQDSATQKAMEQVGCIFLIALWVNMDPAEQTGTRAAHPRHQPTAKEKGSINGVDETEKQPEKQLMQPLGPKDGCFLQL